MTTTRWLLADRSMSTPLGRDELAEMLSAAAGYGHSHLGPDCDPVADHGGQATRLMEVLAARGYVLVPSPGLLLVEDHPRFAALRERAYWYRAMVQSGGPDGSDHDTAVAEDLDQALGDWEPPVTGLR